MSKNKKIVAFDLGSQRVSAARFALLEPGKIQMEDFGVVDLLGDPSADSSRMDQVKQAVEELSSKLKVGASEAYYTLSGQSVFVRFVKLPSLGDENIEKMVQFEAQQNVPFPMNEVIWDYQFMGRNKEGEAEVLLVAIKGDSLDEYNEAIDGIGLRTELFEVAPFSIYNASVHASRDEQASVVIDVGARSTNFLFKDGDGFFARTIPVGGSQITSSIAKEFGFPFSQAEELKLKKGFVSLGGAYADHDDPQIAAMSKVIRNTLGRLHTEYGRTANVFKAQHGGSLPKKVYLSGGSVAMPYLKEFFEEKLNLPVEYLNPFKNVTISSEVDGDKLKSQAHNMAELVGLALRASGKTPLHLELIPDAVSYEREVTKKKPYLLGASLLLLGLLGAGTIYYSKAKSVISEKLTELTAESQKLGGLDTQIKAELKKLNDIEGAATPLTDVVNDRSYWVRVLADLNSKFSNDLIWYTSIKPKSQGISVMDNGDRVNRRRGPRSQTQGDEKLIDSIIVSGLYRAEAGSRIVNEHVETLRGSEYLDMPKDKLPLSKIIRKTSGEENDGKRWAYDFELELPLKTDGPYGIKVSKK